MSNFLRCDVRYATCRPNVTDPYDHSQTCHRCAAPYRMPRHQRVLHALQRAAHNYGMCTTVNFKTTLGTTDDRQRPDLLIYREATNLKPLALDVSCPHQSTGLEYNALRSMHRAKIGKYTAWHQDLVDFAPCIVSTQAIIEPSTKATLAKLAPVASGPGFVRDAIARMKVAVINNEPFRRAALALRKANGTLDRDLEDVTAPTQPSPDQHEQQHDDGE